MNAYRTMAQEHALRKVRGALEFRRNRDSVFGAAIVSNPAWDILLELYEAALEERQLTVAALCDRAAPTSVVVRWLEALSNQGLLLVDDMTARASTVTLTDGGLKRMESLFA